MHRLPQKSSLVAQTAAILKERLLAGEWHKWMPGEHELSAELHVARMTLRRALQQLEGAGLIRASQGKRRQIAIARAAPKASGRVLLLTPLALPFQLPYDIFWANELRQVLAEAGYHLEIHTNRALYGRGVANVLERMADQLRPVGYVITHSTQQMQRWFSKHRLPCVIVGSRHAGIELPSVDKAYRAVCRHAVGLFLARGHQRLALINPEAGAAGDFESEQGFRQGAAQSLNAGVQISVVRHNGTVADICNKLNLLMRRPDRPTALLVSRSMYVLTVMGHLMRSGLNLPQDVALISRDHEPFLEKVVPSVARYVVSPETMARRISSAVLESVQSGLVNPGSSQIMPEFTEGNTLGPKRDPARPDRS